jgi:hypothetical protein
MQLVTDAIVIVLAPAMAVVLGVGAGAGALRAGYEPRSARRLGLTVIAAIAVWLLVAALLASSGLLSVWTARPPRVLLLPLTAFSTMMVVSRTRAAGLLVSRVPRHWPIAAQAFRIAVELAIFGLYIGGRAPVQMTFEGRNLDVLVGLSAPVVAWLVAVQRARSSMVVVWNLAGLVTLANVIGTAATSIPGALRLDWPGQPFTALATFPVVWIPAFLAPAAVFLHITSLRQSLRGLERIPKGETP